MHRNNKASAIWVIIIALSVLQIDGVGAEDPQSSPEIDMSAECYPFTEVDKKPVCKKLFQPDPISGLKKMDAQVVVVVDTDGKVALARLIKASHKEFGEKAVQSAKKCIFTVAEKGGRKVRCVMVIPYSFELGTRLRVTGGAMLGGG